LPDPESTSLVAPLLAFEKAGAVAPSDPGVVDLWRIDLGGEPPADFERFLGLDAEEIARAGRFRYESHRRRFILARGALRRILSRYVETPPGDLRFFVESAGKPRLAGRDVHGVEFSASRTQTHALVAIARFQAIGLDIETVAAKSDLDLVAREQFSPRERAELQRLSPDLRLEAFYRGWTAKEALVKATGEGLSSLLPRMTVELDPRLPAALVDGPGPYAANRWRLNAFAVTPVTLGCLAFARPISAIRGFILEF
jgi:4'-phosphopantetheinyl transferase